MQKQPKTAADFMALPRRYQFTERLVPRGGPHPASEAVVVPVVHQFALFYAEPDTIMTHVDEVGNCWRLALDRDGYCRVSA